ncbi:TonB-dependent receptor plug domain-containing protein [Steroidobacter agaridevorans]|uniref:TonB-dependent receptor plug domain-containing protein n=1 Tax=Steroidobacter agaridevorans TaxID=2695856 RepID=UPI00132402AE|nr:TonB-dependent receptor [Steroidobacter agaridevorans]GFE89456.1 TonB-dependent receptor [Steroidobacter agaridevorans]
MKSNRSPWVRRVRTSRDVVAINRKLRDGVRGVLAGSLLLGSGAVMAQQAGVEELEVIVVTGSYIQGTAEDAALPVDVFTADDLQMQGSPTMVDLVKSIPAVQGVLGESNQFGSAQSTGSSNINLRGIGAVRTLVLMNGRRIAGSPTGNGVDTNLLPMAAIGRIEVLKDGAAATYGSDAVAGVVNFITKTNVEGLSLDASYSYIDGSDGDYHANALWGHRADTWNVLVAAGYRHRSELNTTERDWAVRSYDENPQGGYSGFGNPGQYNTTALTRADGTVDAAGSFRDPGCTALGGFEVLPGDGCRLQYITFDNLAEREEHYQLYSEFNMDIGEKTAFHLEALYAVHDAPEENSSPSYGPQQGANLTQTRTTGLLSPNYIIPLSNPGLRAILPLLDAGDRADVVERRFVVASGLQWRPLGNGGNPLTGEGKKDERLFDGFRVSAGLNGEFGPDIGWDTAVTYSENTREVNTPDILAYRLQLALNGLGGPNCAPGGTAGQGGCLFFNPFSNAFAGNPSTGAVNNLNYDPALANDRSVVDWMFEDTGATDTSSTLAVDLVFNGELPLSLPGGAIGWAAGGQYRDEGYEREVNYWSDIDLNPCVDTPVNGNMGCTTQFGVFTFFGPQRNQDLSRDVFGVFGEVNLPLLESLQAQVALRYEDYGGLVGSTTNPKISLRWQALDWLAFRGSAGSTFRGPQQTQLLDGFSTTLVYTGVNRGYKPYDNYGNPDLKPEEADTFNFGTIVQAGNFKASLDYWRFNFENPIGTEGGTELVATFFGVNPGDPNRCNDPAYDALQTRFTFTTAGACSAAALIRTRVDVINGPEEKISGLDASLSYLFEGVAGGDLLVGADGSYTLKYERDALFVEGVLIQEKDDYAGTRGGAGTGSLPKLRGSTYLDYSLGNHGLRWTTRYIDGVTDVRSSVPDGRREIGSFLTHDLVYRLELPAETMLTASVINLTDRDPPLALLDLSYDPFIGNPLGRYFKLAFSKKIY